MAALFVAVAALVLTSLAWLRAERAVATLPAGKGAGEVLGAFERAHRAERDIDLAGRYRGRLELLDPRLSLPTWHASPAAEARLVHRAIRSCPPEALGPLGDPSLRKAHRWQEATCAGGPPPDELVDEPPFMHPSGRSYAALSLARGDRPAAWIGEHAASFHVLELGALDPASLDADQRALAAIPALAWRDLLRGDAVVLTEDTLLVAERTPLGLSRLRAYERPTWEAFARRASVVLGPRTPGSLCAQPASPALCWEAVAPAKRDGPRLFAATMVSAALVVAAALALALAYLGERRRAHRDRIHVLRTLTHELRTPATSLRLDIEPLRAAYDELPASCQEPLLRLSDGIERLHRVLHRSARYMALFETPGLPRTSLVDFREVASAREMFEELADEWPEGATLVAPAHDGIIRTDPEWLGVAVRNLVENAARHGVPPVAVTWEIAGESLVVRVSDGGTSPGFSLARAVAPYDRDPKSPGLGLGLAIVDRIARLLGGRLSHAPAPTTFELRVPVNGGPA